MRARLGYPEGERMPFQFPIRVSRFFDFNHLVNTHIAEDLFRSARGPPDFECFDSIRAAKSNMLLQRGCAERSAAGHHAVDAAWRSAFAGNRHLDTRPDGRPVGLLTDELENYPMIVMARILK